MKKIRKSILLVAMFMSMLFCNCISVEARYEEEFKNASALEYEKEVKSSFTGVEKKETACYVINVKTAGNVEFYFTSNVGINICLYDASGNSVEYTTNLLYAESSDPKTGYLSKTLDPGYYYLLIERRGESAGNYSVLWGDFSVKKINLNYSELTIEEDDEITLTAEVLPELARNKRFNWETSNNDVVHVYSNGKLLAGKGGQAIVSAVAEDGSGVKASCVVTVIPPAPTNIEDSNDYSLSATAFTIEWDKVDGANGYNVYLLSDSTGQFELYKTVTDNSCAFTKLKPEKQYSIQVSSYMDTSTGRLEGKKSSTYKQYTCPKVPGKVKIKSVKKGKKVNTSKGTFYNFTVKWKKSKDATGYIVYGQIKGKTGLKKMGKTKKTKEKFQAGYGYKYYIIVVPYREKNGLISYGKQSKRAVLNCKK